MTCQGRSEGQWHSWEPCLTSREGKWEGRRNFGGRVCSRGKLYMGRYIVKRVLQFIPVFLGVTLILFLLQNVVPGDPIKLMAGEKRLDPVTEDNLRATYHLIETDADGSIVRDEAGNTIETPLWKRYTL